MLGGVLGGVLGGDIGGVLGGGVGGVMLEELLVDELEVDVCKIIE